MVTIYNFFLFYPLYLLTVVKHESIGLSYKWTNIKSVNLCQPLY